jgi:hypothetical protein
MKIKREIDKNKTVLIKPSCSKKFNKIDILLKSFIDQEFELVTHSQRRKFNAEGRTEGKY